MIVHTFNNAETLVDSVTSKVIEIAQQRIRENGQFSIALPGGEHSELLYRRMLELTNRHFRDDHQAISKFWFPWLVFLSHDLLVALDSNRCHYKQIAENWIAHADIPLNHVFPMVTDEEDSAVCVDDYRRALVDYLELNEQGMPTLDLALLEMGDQGQLAAIYPGSVALQPHAQSVEAVATHDSNITSITLSLPMLQAAREVIIIATGAEKAEFFHSLRVGSDKTSAAGILNNGHRCEWYIDQTLSSSVD